jgi:hypothetical protein
VQAILKQHKQYSKLVSKMGKMGAIPKPQDSANTMATMQKVMQDPTSKASQAAISKLVNPQVLKQMGGVSGVTKAMQVLLLYAILHTCSVESTRVLAELCIPLPKLISMLEDSDSCCYCQ